MATFNKQVLITAIILTLFAVTGGCLVVFTEQSTAAQITYNDRQALLRSLNTIIPAEKYDNDMTSSTLSVKASAQLGTQNEATVYIAARNNQPIAFIFNAIAPNGYNGNIYLLIGVYTDGTVAGARVVRHKETPGLGDAIEERRSDWILGFDKHSLSSLNDSQWKVKRDGGVFDQFTGATITPRAVVQSVHQTLLYFKENREQLIQTAVSHIVNTDN